MRKRRGRGQSKNGNLFARTCMMAENNGPEVSFNNRRQHDYGTVQQTRQLQRRIIKKIGENKAFVFRSILCGACNSSRPDVPNWGCNPTSVEGGAREEEGRRLRLTTLPRVPFARRIPISHVIMASKHRKKSQQRYHHRNYHRWSPKRQVPRASHAMCHGGRIRLR